MILGVDDGPHGRPEVLISLIDDLDATNDTGVIAFEVPRKVARTWARRLHEYVQITVETLGKSAEEETG